MKYSLILTNLIVCLISVNGEIPDYIHTCTRSDPQISSCVHNSITNLTNKLVDGIPELGVPSIDPIQLDTLSLNLGPGLKAEGYNLQLQGGKNFEIHDLNVDIDADIYSFNVTIPEVVVRGFYDIDATLGSIPIKGKGPIYLIAKSVSSRGILQGKKVMRGGKTFYWFPSMKMKVNVGDYNIKLENLFPGDPTIGEVTHKLLNEEKTEILGSVLPVIEKAMIEHILLSANNICKNFTWDELFPK